MVHSTGAIGLKGEWHSTGAIGRKVEWHTVQGI